MSSSSGNRTPTRRRDDIVASPEVPQTLMLETAGQLSVGDNNGRDTTPGRSTISSDHRYQVPHLQVPPKRPTIHCNIHNSLQNLGDAAVTDDAVFRCLLPHLARIYRSDSSDTGNSTSESAASSFRLIESPSTPFNSNHSSPVNQFKPSATRSLRPQASAFEPWETSFSSPVTPSSQSNASRSNLIAAGESIWGTTGAVNPVFAPRDVGQPSLRSSFAEPLDSPGDTTRLDSYQPASRSNTRSLKQQQSTSSSMGATHDSSINYTQSSPTSSHTLVEAGGTEVADNTVVRIPGDEDADEEPSTPSGPSTTSTYRDPAIQHPQEEPPIWYEEQSEGSFRLQRFEQEDFVEVYEGAFDILATMNPDHYCMPWGSLVVSVKSSNVANLLLSFRTSVWATQEAVLLRIKALFDGRQSEDERLLLLFSVPGSKQFCGLAEVLRFESNNMTDFWEGEVHHETMAIQWYFCKSVPYEDVRQAVGKILQEAGMPFKGEDATQMWNGMHYGEPLGREVIKAYVEYPHVENLLTKAKMATPAGRGGSHAGQHTPSRRGGRASYRGMLPQRSAPARGGGPGRGNFGRGRDDASAQGPPNPDGQALTYASNASAGTHPSQSFTISSIDAQEPRLQMMPVLVYADGRTALPNSAPVQGGSQWMQGEPSTTAPLPALSPSPLDRDRSHTATHDPRSTPRLGAVMHQPNLSTPSPDGSIRNPRSAVRTSVRDNSPAMNMMNKHARGDGWSQYSSPAPLRTANSISSFRRRDLISTPSPHQVRPNIMDMDNTTPMHNVPRIGLARATSGSVSSQSFDQDHVSANQNHMRSNQGHMSYSHTSQHAHQGQTPHRQNFPNTGLMEQETSGLQSTFRSFSSMNLEAPVPITRETTPPQRNRGTLGHGKRGSEAKSSLDMRTDDWVNKLLASPSKESNN